MTESMELKMEESANKLKETPIVKKEEVRLTTFGGVKQFKSIKRAIRRGNAAPNGEVYPKKPYNCRKATPGRKTNQLKKQIYEGLNRAI